jgi:hypothetical protein
MFGSGYENCPEFGVLGGVIFKLDIGWNGVLDYFRMYIYTFNYLSGTKLNQKSSCTHVYVNKYK